MSKEIPIEIKAQNRNHRVIQLMFHER